MREEENGGREHDGSGGGAFEFSPHCGGFHILIKEGWQNFIFPFMSTSNLVPSYK